MTASFDLKVGRARTHLDQLRSDATAWIDTKPYGLVDELDFDPFPEQWNDSGMLQHRRFRLTHFDPVPDTFSLLIGDCIHNLRSALDHIALALGKAHKSAMSTDEVAKSEFPVFLDRPMNAKEERDKVGCIADAPRTLIKGLQPHLRGNKYRDDPLWQIHGLNIIDKHRMLLTCLALPTGRHSGGHVGYGVIDADKCREVMTKVCFAKATPGILKPNAIFYRYTLVDVYAIYDSSVYMEPILPLQVAFDQGGPAALEGVIPTLNTSAISSAIAP